MDDITIMSTDNLQLNYRQLLRKYELSFNQLKTDIADGVRAAWKERYDMPFDDAYEQYVYVYETRMITGQ